MNYPSSKQRASASGFAAVADRVATKAGAANGLTKKAVLAVIDAFGEELFATVRKMKRVTWPGRGTFRVKRIKARNILNPHTGEVMRLPATSGIGFRTAKAEKARLADAIHK